MTQLRSPVRTPRLALSILIALAVGGAAAATPTPADFMDWAERAYPQYFPGPATNQSSGVYIYRFYPDTGNYVGVSGNRALVYGPLSNNALLDVGALSDFTCRVHPADCGLPNIGSQPKTTYALAGEAASFSINASNATSVQWQISTDGGFSFTDLPGFVGGKVTFTNVGPADNGKRYRVVLSNAKGQVISDVAALYVLWTEPTTGSPAECVAEALLQPGRTVELVAGSAADPRVRATLATTVRSNVVFEGRLVRAYEASAVQSNLPDYTTVDTYFANYEATTGVVSVYGYKVESRSTGYISEETTVMAPPQVIQLAALQPGESSPEQAITNTETSVITTNGKAGAAQVDVYSGTLTETFLGMERVNSRAGSFRTCKVMTTSVVNGRAKSRTVWRLAGYGLPLSGWNSKVSPLLELRVDGVPLRSN